MLLAGVICAFSAAPSLAIMVKLPNGRWANYDPMSGSKAPRAARIFDAAFTNLDYSGGPVMPSNTNYTVVWSPSNYGGHTPFQTGYTAGVGQFFTDMAADSGTSGNSDAVSTQYNDASGHTAAYNFHNGGQLIDTDPLPANGCPANPGDICITDAQIQTELNNFLSAQHVPADLSHEYFLLTPPDVASCFDSAGSQCSGNADQNQAFCAYHSQTPAGYIYANIPDLTGVDGCDPFVSNWWDCPNFSCSYNNGPADGVLSAISHEHNESTTDPQPNNAWTDWGSNVGGEIGDKCNNDGMSDPNLQFGGINGDAPYNETINGDDYLIQREWSNQTAQCLDSFTPDGTTASATFTSSPAGGNTVTFNASGSSASGGVAEYVWQFNDGPGQTATQETTSPTFSHTFPAPGPYTVALTVMAGDGTSNGTARNITVGPVGGTPSASFGAPSGLEGTSLTFDGTPSTDPGGTLSTYAWNFGDGTTGTGAIAHHTYPHYGLYNATLTVTDSANGHTSTASHTVLVSDESPSTPSISTPSGRAASPILFLGYAGDPDGSITSYRWTFGDGGSATGSQVTHTYTSAGQYVVVLTVTDSDGRSASTATTITVGPALNHGHPNSCHVPKLKGKTLSQAKQALKNAGCATGKITKAKKPKRSAGRHHKWQLEVVHQTPGAGKLEQPGSKVALKLAYVAVKTR